MNSGIVLYGPPASGKDTVTAALSTLDDRYVYFHKLKLGAGRSTGYRFTSEEELDDLRGRGLILYESRRYEATYAVDAPHLDDLFGQGRIPVVHMGQLAGVEALRAAPVKWVDVLLWCSRKVSEKRLKQRGSGDIDRRLAAWDETAADLGTSGRERFTIVLRTDALSPQAAASAIQAVLPGDM